jgi:hypothetical protein
MSDEELIERFKRIIKYTTLSASDVNFKLETLLVDFNNCDRPEEYKEIRKRIEKICEILYTSETGACTLIRFWQSTISEKINNLQHSQNLAS